MILLTHVELGKDWSTDMEPAAARTLRRQTQRPGFDQNGQAVLGNTFARGVVDVPLDPNLETASALAIAEYAYYELRAGRLDGPNYKEAQLSQITPAALPAELILKINAAQPTWTPSGNAMQDVFGYNSPFSGMPKPSK